MPDRKSQVCAFARSWAGALRETSRRTYTPKLIARHPSYRRYLRLGLFVNEAHAGVTCAIAGAVVASRMRRGGRAVALLAALPYLRGVARNFAAGGPVTPRRLARLALHLPLAASVDLVETTATIRGAVRYRTPVV